MPAEVWPYNSAVAVARIFHMRIDFAVVVPMVGRDIYLRGKRTMHSKLLGMVTVARSEGSETDLSELATYLNDAVLMAPSMQDRQPERGMNPNDVCELPLGNIKPHPMDELNRSFVRRLRTVTCTLIRDSCVPATPTMVEIKSLGTRAPSSHDG